MSQPPSTRASAGTSCRRTPTSRSSWDRHDRPKWSSSACPPLIHQRHGREEVNGRDEVERFP